MANKKYLGIGAATLLAAGILSCGESPTDIEKRHYQSESREYSNKTNDSTKDNLENLYSKNSKKFLGGLEIRADSTLNLADPVTLLATLLYEEGRECSMDEKILIAYSAVNRSRIKGKSLLEIALKDNQYSCFNNYDPRKGKKVDLNDPDINEWQKCIAVAAGVLTGTYNDPSKGQVTHYFNPKKVNPSWKNTLKPIIIPKIKTKHKFYSA